MKNISFIIRELRKKENLSQREIARKIGVSVSTFSGYETGYSKPKYENIVRMAEIFNVSTDFLLGKQPCVNQNRILEGFRAKYDNSLEITPTTCNACEEKKRVIHGLESQLEEIKSRLSDKDNIIQMQQKQIESLERQIGDLKINMERLISEKSEVVKMKDEMLAMKEEAIKGKEAMLAAKDETIRIQSKRICELEDNRKAEDLKKILGTSERIGQENISLTDIHPKDLSTKAKKGEYKV